MKKTLIMIVLGLSLGSCVKSDVHRDSPIIGSWEWQEPIISNGVDYTEGFWTAHDAMCYEFLENGEYFKYGGPEPLEPTKYNYDMVGDSILYLSEYGDISFTILDVSSDTIWLRSNQLDQEADLTLNLDSYESYSFLKRIVER